MGLRIDTVAFTYSVSKTTENLNATRNSVSILRPMFSRPTNYYALEQITKEKAVTGSAGEF